MICRFCGRKIDSFEKCSNCLKETPVLLDYESYKGNAIIEKLSQVLKPLPTSEDTPSNELNVLMQTEKQICIDISEPSENHADNNCEGTTTSESRDVVKEAESVLTEQAEHELLSNVPLNESCDETSDIVKDKVNANESVSTSAEVSVAKVSEVQNECILQTGVINTNEENIENNAVEQGVESPAVKGVPDKKKVLSIIAAVTAVLVLFGAGCLLWMTNRSNKEEQPSDDSIITSESRSTETSTEELATASIQEEKTTETKNIEIQTTSISETAETDTTEIQTILPSETFETETDAIEIKGKYYSISNSVYSENSKEIFINIFGYKPVECSNEISVDKWGLTHNYSDVDYKFEDETMILDKSFSEIDDDFVEIFNFNEITQSENYDNEDGKSNEFYVFEVENTKMNSTILCNKLHGLSYDALPVDVKDSNYSIEKCLLSISNDQKDSIALYESTYGRTSLKTLYRDSLSDIDTGSGEVVVTNPEDGYEIVRITLDGEKYIYFYRRYDSSDVYMIQYIRYNTLSNGVQDAILRDEEGEMVE